MTTSRAKKLSVAEYLAQQIAICGKSQKEICEEVGYDKPNIITMFKQGKTKIPIGKVPLFAKALGVDPIHMLRLTMLEYSPETWEVIETLLGSSVVSEGEQVIIDIVREASDGHDLAPVNDPERQALAQVVKEWRTRVEKSVTAAEHRIEV